MKTAATIPATTKAKKPFLQRGKKDTFIKSNGTPANAAKRVNKEESKAGDFAQRAVSTPAIVQAYQQASTALKRPPKPKKANKAREVNGLDSFPVPATLIAAFKLHLGEDFTEVRLYADPLSTKIAKEHNAAALTSGDQIFFNTDVFQPGTPEGLSLLAHELFHTIEPGEQYDNIEVQLKPLTEMNDRTPYQQMALERAAKIAVGEQGKVNSNALNDDKTRVGWQFLVEYFRTTFGDDRIVKNKSELKPGLFWEDVIKFVVKGAATKVKVNEKGEHVTKVEREVDLLPSWCGIFAFWALHKSGIHPPPWEVGKPNFTAANAYKKGYYLPRPGDIVIKNGYNHHALVVRTIPDKVTDDKELASVKVVTINGNTAGSNHTGGQIQVKTDPYGYWDFYINPFFKGVELTDEKDFKLDERLKENLGETPAASSASTGIAPADTSVNQYDTSLKPLTLDIPKAEGEEKKEGEEPVEESPLNPKEIMAQDVAYGELQGSLERNAEKEKTHDPAEQKAAEARSSALSPENEQLSQAQALKVQALPAPAKFNAEELKKSILDEVERILKEKGDNATPDDPPSVGDGDVKKIKKESRDNIDQKKQESVGSITEAHKTPPDKSSAPARESTEVIVEDAGPDKKIPDTDKSVAKPVADERITLEEDSDKIDKKMAENDVDEQQLEESNEEKFTTALDEKKGSQSQAANLKEDYRAIENAKLEKDKKNARALINSRVDKIHDVREGEFGNVNTVKGATKNTEEEKRKEIANKIEKMYTDAETSVNTKLEALDKSVNQEFDAIMLKANEDFKESVNQALDDEFVSEFLSKTFDNANYKKRVRKVFKDETDKYTRGLSNALNPLTTKIANTLNGITAEIEEAKKAVLVFVQGLEPALQDMGTQAAQAVLDKFTTLQESVNEKQQALTNGLAKKYADGVMAREEEFKKIMDSRKSWLEKALDAIVDAIKEIIQLLADLKKALERAAEYGKRIIKAPLKFFDNLVKGATEGFNNFVKNIGKHLLQGALEWITGEMGEAGIVLPDKFDFKGILSIILQILGLTVTNIKEIAKKVIGEKYVTMLEKGADLGVKAGDKILQVFTIIKKDGVAGLWEFIKEQFNDLKEKLLEEAKSFIIVTIVEVAVIKVVSMLIPGAGFISAVKSLIDFLRTLFAKARQIVNIITGIIDTFGEILAGNVSKVSSMIENILAKFLGLAITFLAAILGLGKIGKKINDIIQKKIKDPINKAITKMMEKLKGVMTKLGIFKFLDKVDDKIKKGKKWVDDKKEKIKEKAKDVLGKIKGFLGGLFNKYTDESGETHTLKFKGTELYRESVSKTLGNYLTEVRGEIKALPTAEERKKHGDSVDNAFTLHGAIVTLIGKTVKESGGKYTGADEGFSPKDGAVLKDHLQKIASILRTLPLKGNKNIIPKTKITYQPGIPDGIKAEATFISLDSDEVGSQPTESANSPLSKSIAAIVRAKKGDHKLVRGHLINHELFGTGDHTKNLAPIPKKANAQMLTGFEKEGKRLVHSNNVIELIVTVTYGAPNDTQDNGQSLLKNKLPPSTQLPTNVSYKMNQLNFSGISNPTPNDVNNRQKWGTAGISLTGDISIKHNEFF
ncbi:DUF4157 domain-containing protein [Pseudoflavitalea sp. X16]|uniref:eCIS core domain-containing protein n=1 Tax=Paraflavitalea devenefica TaxID=2716334 RepID=UPI00141F9F22|nr:DUF4157 domain-containing protein [Paraflavitalea devenefica]NII27603.1 DUF4157 domain-containing protein [Paraflavitalea devenefica]